MKMASSTQLRYIRASAGRYVFRWDRLLDEGLAFVQVGVPSCPNDVTIRLCANFKCDVADVNKEIHTDFRGVKCVSGECYQPYPENSSWYIRSHCLESKYLTRALLRPILNSLLAPATACESQATACDIEISLDMLWISVNCIFKENIISIYWSISFLNLQIFYFNFYNIFICTICKHFTL